MESNSDNQLPFSDLVTLIRRGTVFDTINDLYVYQAKHVNVTVFQFHISEALIGNKLTVRYVKTHLLEPKAECQNQRC